MGFIFLALLTLAQTVIEPVASAVYSGADRKIVVSDGRLYSACERGLDIFDISQPESIALLGRYNTPGIANGVAVKDTLVFVADRFNGILVLSVADPHNPRLLNSVSLPTVVDVTVKDSFLFAGGEAVMIYSIANPSDLRLIGNLSGISGYRLAVRDSLCFVAAQAGLIVVNIGDLTRPVIQETLATGWLRDVEVSGEQLYCCGDTELLIYDAKNLTRLGKYDAGYLAFGIGIADSLCLVCRGQQLDIHVLNIANPAQPVYRGRFTAQNGPQDAAVSGRWGYVGVWSRDLLVADLTNPASPLVRARVFRPGELNGAWRDGNLVVTADRWYGLSVVDVSDINHPVEMGHLPLSGWPRRLVLRDTIAYVANYDGLVCVSVADPAHPYLLGQVATSYYTYKVTVKDTIAYVAEREWNPYHGNLHCISISDPRNPRILGSYATNGGGVEALAYKVDNYCYVVSQGWNLNEFAIVNVSNPFAPYRVSGCNTNGYPVDVDAAGDYAYVAITSPNQRIQVIDISDTLAPQIVAELQLQNNPIAIYLHPPYLFVSYYYYGIEVFDITDPLNLKSLATYNTTGNSFGMFVDPQLYIYLADAHSLEILHLIPTAIAEERSGKRFSFPTICHNRLQFSNRLRGNLKLYDLTGRVIRTMEIDADNVDLSGLNAGVYMVSLETPEQNRFYRLVILK
ncbi:MAG: T9SS type A sorting domain-containing protein [candidate division WOR-3 bacterium]